VRRITVLLADDNPDILSIIQEMLTPTFDVVALARDGESLVAAAEEHDPDIIVTDISMPGLNGIDAAKQILERDPRSKIVMLTVNRDRTLAESALASGALGYVLKLYAGEELIHAVRQAMEGRKFVSPVLYADGFKEPCSEACATRALQRQQTTSANEDQPRDHGIFETSIL
jgi:DNA-binding NarL/FixJ family response regulator